MKVFLFQFAFISIYFSSVIAVLGLPKLCWIEVKRVGILVMLLILKEILAAFHVKYDASCGLVIYGLYYTKEYSLSAHFLERFYHKLMFSFIESFVCVCWNDHMVFILQFVNDIGLQILKSSCILGVNPNWSWFIVLLTYVSVYLLWINVYLGLLPIFLIAFFCLLSRSLYIFGH